MIKIKVKQKRPLFKRKRDNYAKKLKRQQLVNYLREELRSSTTHGLPYIVNPEIHWVERVFWAISFVSCTVLVFVLLNAQYSRFIETPIVMSVEMDYFNWNVSYPAFTLCPDFKPDIDALSDLMNTTYAKAGPNLDAYLYTIVTTNMETLKLYDLQLVSPEVLPLIDPRDYSKLAASVFMQFEGSSVTTNTNEPVTLEPVMTELGMCHVVNSDVAQYDNPIKWGNRSAAAPYVKRSIVLSVHDRDFFTQLMNYADVYTIYIHSSDETILTTTPSYTQSDRGFLSFGVQVWSNRISDVLRHAPIKLRKCRFINEPISKRYPVYSYNHCMLECKISMIMKLCGCIPHFYKPLDHERVCYINELECVIQYKKEIRTLSASKETLSRFPDAKALPRSPRDCGCLNSCETDKYQKDFETFMHQTVMNRLRIGISSFPKVRVVRDIIFSYYDIILRSGGVVNLCIGTSMLSIMELIFTAIRIPFYLLKESFKNLWLRLK